MQTFEYIVFNTADEAVGYLDSIRENIDTNTYKKAKTNIFNHYKNNKVMTIKMIHNHLTCLELIKQGKYEEAENKSYEFAVENINIYLKKAGIIQ